MTTKNTLTTTATVTWEDLMASLVKLGLVAEMALEDGDEDRARWARKRGLVALEEAGISRQEWGQLAPVVASEISEAILARGRAAAVELSADDPRSKEAEFDLFREVDEHSSQRSWEEKIKARVDRAEDQAEGLAKSQAAWHLRRAWENIRAWEGLVDRVALGVAPRKLVRAKLVRIFKQIRADLARVRWVRTPEGVRGVCPSGYTPTQLKGMGNTILTLLEEMGYRNTPQLFTDSRKAVVILELPQATDLGWAGRPWAEDEEVRSFFY